MGTITTRKRKDGSKRYTALIRVKVQGEIVHSEGETFSKLALAQAWIKRREAELEGARAQGRLVSRRMTVGELLTAYAEQAQGISEWGRSKKADIARLQGYAIARLDARLLTAADLINHAKARRLRDGAGPSTVLNDVIWLRQVFLMAAAVFDMEQPLRAVDAAKIELMRTKVIAKPQQRKRRLPAEEEQLLTDFFARRDRRSEIPMGDIMKFALLTARRQDEICRLKWVDVDFDKGTGWIDDVKHPTQKTGNRREFRILRAAMEIIERQARTSPEVFPYNSRSVSAAFTRACKFLGLEDLHFHDLRHEATSRLFEKGYSIQEVAQFTLHDSWATLKRYTHLRPQDVPERG